MLVCLVSNRQPVARCLSCLFELRRIIASHGGSCEEVVAAGSARISLGLGFRVSALVNDDNLLSVFVGLCLALRLLCLDRRTLVCLDSRCNGIRISVRREGRRLASS